MKTAHYFASKQAKKVVIAVGPRPVGEEYTVSGKAEARKIAKQHNAQPWNF